MKSKPMLSVKRSKDSSQGGKYEDIRRIKSSEALSKRSLNSSDTPKSALLDSRKKKKPVVGAISSGLTKDGSRNAKELIKQLKKN